MTEEHRTVAFQGQPLTLLGTAVHAGEPAPEFRVLNREMSSVSFDSFQGKVTLLLSVPSLDTEVCSREAHQFNEIASRLKEVEIITISMDLPFAQKRWCSSSHIQDLEVYSDHRDASFGYNYGTLVRELRLLARAVFLVDDKGIVRYVEYVPEITQEPDYQAVLKAVQTLMA